MQPGDGDALKKVTLTDAAGVSFDLIVKGGDKNIVESPIGAEPKLSGGARKFGDYDPSFGFVQVSTFERGWGNKDLADDEARFKWASNAWTLTRNTAFPVPFWEQIRTDIGYLGASNLTSGYGGGSGNIEYGGNYSGLILNSTVTSWAVPFTVNDSNCVLYRATVWGKWNKSAGTSFTLKVNILSDSGGSPGSLVGGAESSSPNTQFTEFENVYQPLDFFFTSPGPSLTASTPYWLEVMVINLDASDTLQLGGAATDLYGAGAKYSSPTWTTGQDAFAFSLQHRVNHRSKTKLFEFGGALFGLRSKTSGANQLFIMGEGGFATSATGSTLVDTNMGLRGSWTTNQFSGKQIKIVAGTGVGQVRSISSNTNAGSITISGDNWAINPDSTSRYVIVAPLDWYEIASGTHGITFCNDASPAGAVCYFARGASLNVRRMKWNTSADPLLFADDGTNKMDILYHASGRIWGCLSSTGTVSYSGIKAWGTNLAFTALAITTPIEDDFRGIGFHAGNVYFIKESSIWFCDAAGNVLYEHPVNMKYFRSSNNGTAVISHQEYLYFNWGGQMQRLSGLSVEQVDPDKGEGIPAEWRGQITGIAPHPAGVFFSIGGNKNTRSTVNVYDGLGFHNVLDLNVKGHKITDIQFFYVEDDKPLLFVATNETIIVQAYPQDTTVPLKDTDIKYCTQGEIELATIDMGGKALPKLFKAITLWGKNLLYSDDAYNFNRFVVFYNADNAGWVYHGRSDSEQYGESSIVFADTTNSSIAGLGNVRELKIKIVLCHWLLDPSVTTLYLEGELAPELEAVTVKGFARTPIQSVFSFPVDVSAVTERLESGNPDTMMAQFWTWAQNSTALYMTSQHPRLHQKTVIVIPRSLRTAYVDRSNETFAADFFLELREIS